MSASILETMLQHGRDPFLVVSIKGGRRGTEVSVASHSGAASDSGRSPAVSFKTAEVRRVSEAFAEAVQRPCEELVGRPLRELLDPGSSVPDEVLTSLLSSEHLPAELAFRRGASGQAWFDVRAHGPSEDGELVLFAFETTGRRIACRSTVQLATIAAHLPGVLWTTDLDLVVSSVTGGGLALGHRVRKDLVDRPAEDFFAASSAALAAHRGALDGRTEHYELESGPHVFHVRVEPVRTSDGMVSGVIGLALEVSRPRDIEGRLRFAQREQTLGRLAGTMAHEFNNLLTVIAAHAALLEDQLAAKGAREDLEAVREAAHKGRLLTSRLLSFTSRQIQQPERVRVDQLVSALEPMLRAIAGEQRKLDLRIDPGGWVNIDPALLEQVVLNLVDNAGQATDHGGVITVRSRTIVDEQEGSRVEICVSDDGVGMNEVIRRRACEPFFTTRSLGDGTGCGLGLATALSVVTEAGGQLLIESSPARGTQVRVVLPAAKAPSATYRLSESLGGDETILLVEDQLGVRRAARRILRRAGYQVFEAAHADDALAVATTFPGELDLLLTDVVMPQVSGPQLARQVLEQRPEVRVLYMSGYAEDAQEVRAALELGQTFLAKPFTPEQLLSRVRRALGDEDEEDEEDEEGALVRRVGG